MVKVTSDTQFVGSHSGELVMPRARSVSPTTPAARNPTPRHEEVSSTRRTHREEMGHAKARQTIATTSPVAAFPHCAAAGLSNAWLTSGLTWKPARPISSSSARCTLLATYASAHALATAGGPTALLLTISNPIRESGRNLRSLTSELPSSGRLGSLWAEAGGGGGAPAGEGGATAVLRPIRLPASCPRLRGSCSGWLASCRTGR